jgi:hypothetical protein
VVRGAIPAVHGVVRWHCKDLVLWDGVRVFTVDDGWGWIFTAIE